MVNINLYLSRVGSTHYNYANNGHGPHYKLWCVIFDLNIPSMCVSKTAEYECKWERSGSRD